jgi:hypothetical protein
MIDPAPSADAGSPRLIGVRVIVGVCLAWLFLGLVWGAQTTMGAILRGVDPVPLGTAIRMSFTQMLPWIPVTLAAIALTRRFPLTGALWKRSPTSSSCLATG